MKKEYFSPEFELLKLSLDDVICGDSRTEGGNVGGDWGASGGGDPGED